MNSKIEITKELKKSFDNVNHYSSEMFISDAIRYAKAIRDDRVICSIGSVSNSGMSRTIKFLAPEKNKARKGYQYYNFFAFFKVLGFSPSGKYGDYFRISGCGMDMIFHTNYSIIHRLGKIGILNKKEVSILCQKTPQVI